MGKKTQSPGRKRKNFLPAVIILFVSGSAFLAGFLQSEYAEDAETLRQDAIYHQELSNEMKNTFLRLNGDEFREYDKAVAYQVQAVNLIIDFLNIASQLTPEETQSYLDRIAYNYWQMEWALESTWSFLIFYHFEIDEFDESYVLDVYLDLNYTFWLTKEMYFSYTRPITILTAEEFLTENLVETGIVSSEEESIIPLIINNSFMPEILVSIEFDTLTDIVTNQAFKEKVLASEKAKQANTTEQLANRITVGVSITTVASILAAAMSNRLENRQRDEHLSKIRADILEDETLIVSGRDLLSVLVLILSAIIAVIGLLYPIYLATFPGI